MNTVFSNDADAGRSSAAPLLFGAAVIVLMISAAYHFLHVQELAGSLCYELDSSRFLLTGRLPYYDFYFDENPAVLWMRAPTIWIAQMISFLPLGSGAVIAPAPLGLASFVFTTLLQLLSFCFTARMVSVCKLNQFGAAVFGALLLGWAVFMLATGFTDGCLQHIFVSLIAPYVVLKCLLACGLSVGPGWRVGAAIAAGFGAALDPFFVVSLLVVESIELIAGRKPGLEAFALPLSVVVTVLSFATLNPAALRELNDWILAVKYLSMRLDQIEYFGLTSVPDRREQFYLLTALIVPASALVRRLPVLRPPAVLALCGLGIYLTEQQGLSSDVLLMMWGSTLGLFVLFQYFVYSSGRTFLRRIYMLAAELRGTPCVSERFRSYAQELILPVMAFFVCSFIASSFLEQRQSAEDALQPTSDLDTECYHPATFLSEPATFELGDKALILCGHKVPAYPVYTESGRQACGYFTNFEPLSVLRSAKEHRIADEEIGKPKGWLDDTYQKLWTRLEESIASEKPAFLLVSSGPFDAEFTKRNTLTRLKKLYVRKNDTNYFSSQCGPSEYNGWNYRYATYVLRGPSAQTPRQ